MKKIICLLPALCCVGLLVAQNSNLSGGLYKHAIEVEAYDDWGKGYLTVIDNNTVKIGDVRYLTAFEPVLNEETAQCDPQTGRIIIPTDAIPEIGDIIYEANGQSTYNMTPEQFYEIIDGGNSFILKYERGENNIVTYAFDRYTEPASIVMNYYIDRMSKKEHIYEFGLPYLMTLNNGYFARTNNRKRSCGDIFSEISDKNFDFHNCSTYDYQITGDDPLNDQKILDEIHKMMTRNTKNPDIIFTIKKKMEGSVYLELTALDAKRLNKKKNSVLPVVWKMIVQREKKPNENFIETYKTYAGWAALPLNDRLVFQENPLYQTSGIEIDNTRHVTHIYEGSMCSFLEEGDEIVKIEVIENCLVYNKENNYEWRHDKKIVLKKNDITSLKLDEHLSYLPHLKYVELEDKYRYGDIQDHIIITYKRNGKKKQGIVRPKLQTATRKYLLNKDALSNI